MCDCHFVSVICCLDVSKIGWHWLNNLDSPYHLLKMNDIMDFMDGGQNLGISSPYTRFEMWTYVFFTKKGIQVKLPHSTTKNCFTFSVH